MSQTLSIVVPFLSESRCIALCRDLITKNTSVAHEIIEIVDCPNVYRAYNEGAAKATGDVIVLLNDDMFVAPGWIEQIVESTKPKTVVTTYLVESGRYPVNHRNIHRNFGQSIESFDYEKFVEFAEASGKNVPAARPGLGWYMPVACRRQDFIPFPREDPKIPCDILLFGMFASRNYDFVQVRSYAYHLQRMTAED